MTPDVIVVGTGAGGGMAAKTLCEAGLRVLALNPGRRLEPARDYRNHKARYEMPFRGFGDPRTKHVRYHDESEYTEGLWEHDIPYTTAPGTEYEWLRVKVTGGKANFWGRSSPRFGDIDFRAASRDGVDVDWPVTYEEIAPYYARVERYIGVASTVQGRPSNPDGEYLPPMQFRCLDHILKQGADRVGVPYLPDRIAQLTRPHGDRPRCHYCGNCSDGCDTGSFFSPTWFTIPDAERTGRLELRTNAIVRHVLVDDRGHANGVAYVERDTRRDVEVRARAVVLAASCMESAHIMLNSRSGRWPDGIANGSGQLGRNLCDHLYGNAAYGCLPQLVGREPFPDNVSASTIAWMPRWQNLDNPRQERFVRGYAVYPGGGCGGFPYYYGRFEGFGSAFKRRIRDYYPAPVGFTIQAPSLPSPDNYVDIDPDVKDPFGIPVLRFHFRWGPNELLMWDHAKGVCAEVLRAAGGEYWGSGEKPETPGFSQHETGVCRFGNDAKRFVTNRWGQCHEVPTLYVCDAGIFPFPTDKTTTISILAFTLRACEHLVEEIRRA